VFSLGSPPHRDVETRKKPYFMLIFSQLLRARGGPASHLKRRTTSFIRPPARVELWAN